MYRKFAWLAALVLAFAPAAVVADHEARYDFSQTVSVSGTLVAVSWQFPRIFLSFDIADGANRTERWSAMTGNPGQLGRAGIADRKQLQIGGRYEIEANPGIGGAKTLFLKSLKGPDGRLIQLGM